ncbi:MAG: UvrD-helicase domain-containing protein, partial [Desulfobacterales bacterium]|nr:UvrD-helicase domain-containing protein [Desulfobacterales bacterium]
MKFIADLHIHSRFSRATSKTLDFENLYRAARLKGITVLGTGDFTHPGWFAEIEEKLEPAEPGLFKLREGPAKRCEERIPASCKGRVRFMLQAEISNIYKKNDVVRKNHNLVYFPNLASAEKFNAKLDAIGNIKSDGRPILGLDAKELLSILLDVDDNGFLVPAHIWTPWFSVLGSKSGFDAIQECFEDLTPHIFAVETGLSSDPSMNWRVSQLDRFTLVSNSDAHSPAKLGREANLFDAELSYMAIRTALETGNPDHFKGTFEFFPEEGKYHADGHRKCDVRLQPEESLKKKGICPVCGKPMTLGVLHRVEALADRPPGGGPENRAPYYNLIPLVEVLSEIMRVGPTSKRVQAGYDALIHKLGPEFQILHALDEARLDQAGVPLLGEAIRRVRRGEVHLNPGYDGEFGTIRIFNDEERERLMRQKSLFNMGGPGSAKKKAAGRKKKAGAGARTRKKGGGAAPSKIGTGKPSRIGAGKPSKNGTGEAAPGSDGEEEAPGKPRVGIRGVLKDLNDQQRRAAEHQGGPLIIVAGPGTGKTRTLTCRVALLIKERGASPDNILAVTFTNKAAREMSDRLSDLLGGFSPLPHVATFHSISYKMLKEMEEEEDHFVIDDDDRKAIVTDAVAMARSGEDAPPLKPGAPGLYMDLISRAKQLILGPGDDLAAAADGSDPATLAEVY